METVTPTDFPIDVCPQSIKEISMAIRQTKSGKAARPDIILAEASKADVSVTVKILHILFNNIWDEEQVPTDCKEGYLYKIQKKDDFGKRDNKKTSHFSQLQETSSQSIVKQNEGLRRRPTPRPTGWIP
ncbi:unnamed protein product [Schistosoma mattheei]|uniref:Uncharacterized protein n=1 Tax=Schistosoma mattheei TaxID=31246 RepID=A0A183Q1W3_9TREM|nr:unnamed protein product [Schistosoma mattheei]